VSPVSEELLKGHPPFVDFAGLGKAHKLRDAGLERRPRCPLRDKPSFNGNPCCLVFEFVYRVGAPFAARCEERRKTRERCVEICSELALQSL